MAAPWPSSTPQPPRSCSGPSPLFSEAPPLKLRLTDASKQGSLHDRRLCVWFHQASFCIECECVSGPEGRHWSTGSLTWAQCLCTGGQTERKINFLQNVSYSDFHKLHHTQTYLILLWAWTSVGTSHSRAAGFSGSSPFSMASGVGVMPPHDSGLCPQHFC